MRSQGQSHGGMRHLFGIVGCGMAILAMLLLGLFQPVGAQPAVYDPTSCGHFATQDDAQAALDADPALATTLDNDGNGIACEDLPAGERSVVVCNESLGTLVEVSQTALDQGSLDFPYHLATDAEIAVGECAATANDPNEPAPGDDDEPARVVVCNEESGELVETSEENANLGQIDFPYHIATEEEIAAGSCAATSGPDPDTFLTIFKANCPNAAAAEDLYANCEPGGNATFEIATADGDVLGSCTTEVGLFRGEKAGFCIVEDVPFDTRLVITEDVSTGFVPLENPKTLTIERPNPDAADFTPAVTFVNLPAEDLETPEPTPPTAPVTPKADGKPESGAVTALPKTGTGTSEELSLHGPLLAATLMMLVLTRGAIELRSRFQGTQAYVR